MEKALSVSVVATVYNEGENIRRLLDSLAGQSRRPDEVVICDGGSSDDTLAILSAYAERLPGLTVLVEPGANISRGRNLAIATAAGPLIAVTDAGVRLDVHWLRELIAPFEDARRNGEEGVNAVAGFFLPDAEGVWQTALAATTLPLARDVDPARFLPSSRSVAFCKELWQKAGGYPEWLDYGEDLVFDLRVGSRFVWCPRALVYFRPRPTPLAFWRQYYRYARGDGKADLWPRRHAIRYGVYLILLPGLIGHGLRGRYAPWLGWLGLATGVIAYCRRPWQRLGVLGARLSAGRRLAAGLLVPGIRALGDLAKMGGYGAGLVWRWRHRRRPEIHWR